MPYRAPRRKKRKTLRTAYLLVVVPILAIGGWWYFGGSFGGAATSTSGETGAEDVPVVVLDPNERTDTSTLVNHEEEVLIPGPADDAGASENDQPIHDTPPPPPGESEDRPVSEEELRTGLAEIERARKLIGDDQLIEARHLLNALLERRLTGNQALEVRRLLTRLAEQTIFGPKVIDGDPLTGTYTVQSGDVLVKIAPQFNVPHEALMRVNNIRDASRLRVNQRLKIIRGPFHVKIDKSEFRMDVYLRDLYVHSFPVGLGRNGTPTGKWTVKNRLKNPRYYPPASSPYKHEVAADDPNNPLGERWIGLEGVSGEAQQQEGYGIHGTIDPHSIGKAVSLGCIRMHNDDVEFLYDLLVADKSTVTVKP